MVSINSATSRAFMARLDAARQDAQAQAEVESTDQDSSPVALLQRFIQNSDEMSAALTRFRHRRHFELKADSCPESFEAVLDDDALPKAQQVLALARVADKPVEWFSRPASTVP